MFSNIIKGIVNRSITSVSYQGDSIGPIQAVAFAEALKTNNSVTSVQILINDINDDGARALAEALKVNRSVKSLDLSANCISNAGVMALAEALNVNQSVTSISIGGGGRGVRTGFLDSFLTRNIQYKEARTLQLKEEIERNEEVYMSIEELNKAISAGRIMQAEKIIEKMKPEDFKPDLSLKNQKAPNPDSKPPYEVAYQPIIRVFDTAAELGQNNILELMLNKNPELVNISNWLHPAARDGNEKLVKILLNKMSPQVVIEKSNNAFTLALDRKHEKVLELLVENEAVIKGVNNSNSKGILYLLAEKGYYKMAGIISPEKLINMLNPQDKKACDPSIAETLYKAVFAYDVDINFHPEIAENYFRKANILYAIGKKEEAIKCYDKVIEIDSDYMDRIASNIQELLAGSNSKNQHLLAFLDHIKDLKTIDTSDLEHK